MNKQLCTLVVALACASSAAYAKPDFGVIDPGLIIDPGDLIGPILPFDPCNGANHRFTVDGGTVTKLDEATEPGAFRATATGTLTNKDPSGPDGYFRQNEVATLTGGEFSWNSQDIFVLQGFGWVSGQSFARNTLEPQTGSNGYWGIVREIVLDSTKEPLDFKFRYLFDNTGGDVEVCFFEI